MRFGDMLPDDVTLSDRLVRSAVLARACSQVGHRTTNQLVTPVSYVGCVNPLYISTMAGGSFAKQASLLKKQAVKVPVVELVHVLQVAVSTAGSWSCGSSWCVNGQGRLTHA